VRADASVEKSPTSGTPRVRSDLGREDVIVSNDGASDVRATSSGGTHVLEADEPRVQREHPHVSGALPDGEAEIELRAISKRFTTRTRDTLALTNIDLGIRKQEFVTLLGQSGCGKTTLLRILAGLTHPTEGEVTIAGRSLWRGERRDDEALRKLGVVFQDANLFPWFSVEDNIALPLRLRKVDKAERRRRSHELAELVGLQGFEKALPRELSGGMRQRVAIARALSYRPEILLMDEPFGALDAMTRDKMNMELQRIAEATRATVVFVTHSIAEAVFLADRVVLLSARPGRIRSITAVDAPHPRSLEITAQPDFQEKVLELRRQLTEDEERIARQGGVSE
jgi:NitT/TauT family transport system ATP-binding protein